MISTPLWAFTEFSEASLGDRRRTRRLVQVAEDLARTPTGTLPTAFENWADLKAAYRLLECSDVTPEGVMGAHIEQTGGRCGLPGEYLCVEDTTTLTYSNLAAATGLGPTHSGKEKGRGFYLHSDLAMRIEGWDTDDTPQVLLQGLLAQERWVRPAKDHGPESKHARLCRARESQRWGRGLEGSEVRGPGVRWTYVADRESDIYEVFLKCRDRGMGFIIRAAQPRALSEADGSVFSRVAEAPILGHFTLPLRARPGQKARTARLAVRACAVTLRGPWRPGVVLDPLAVNVVEAREIDPPAGVTPIRWVLLTDWPVEDFKAAKRVVKAYSRRWLVEEFHKVLKTGLRAEESQLSEARRLQVLVAILSVVAVRLLNTKLLAVHQPTGTPNPADWGPEALAILDTKFTRPAEGWTNRTVWIAVARLGGFIARASDKDPGWLTIWRGLQRLMLLVEGYQLAKGKKCG
jgi:hypothetical protein